MVATNPVVAPVPRLWPGETVVCLGSGPSLTPADVDFCRGRARVIAIKDSYRLAPWADALYSADERWWNHYAASLDFAGQRFALVSHEPKYLQSIDTARAHLLTIGGATGIDADPRVLRTGNHSGYSVINLAVHLGASRIVLLGYDFKPAEDGRHNFFGAKAYAAKNPPYQWMDVYASLVAPLAALGVRVINASRETALNTFERMTIDEALA